MNTTTPFMTLPAIARQHGFSERKANYVVNEDKISPTIRVGIVRLFDPITAQRIVEAVNRRTRRREVAHV